MFVAGFLNYYSKELSILHRLVDSSLCLILFNLFVNDLSSVFNFQIKFFVFIICFISLSSTNLYQSFRNKSLFYVSQKIIFAWLFFLSSFSLILFFFKIGNLFSRTQVIFWLFSFLLILNITHLITRKILKVLRISGRNSRNILFCGGAETLKGLQKEIESNPSNGLLITAWFDYDSSLNGSYSLKNISYLDEISELESWLIKNEPNLIIFTQGNNNFDIDTLLNIIGDTTIPIFYMPSILGKDLNFKKANIGQQIILQVYGQDDNFIGRIIKRNFDIIFSILLLIIFFPVLILISISIKISSEASVIFKQKRYGLNGKPFLIYKFRTMNISEEKNELQQARKKDPRVTKLGFFLRKYSLDELPQLFNVLEGSMSLVGPRPHAVQHNEYYRKFIKGYMQRHSFKPGMTGLAQISGLRGETEDINLMEKRVQADLKYIREWSLLFDLEILIKTLYMFTSKRAY